MITKSLFDKILRKLPAGAIEVTYWSGETVKYGQGEPYAHITVKNARAIRAMVASPSLAFGEGYTRGDIQVEGDLRQVARYAGDNGRAMRNLAFLKPFIHLGQNRNHRGAQAGQIQTHYDRGNDFYKLWLDDSMTYSCAYFKKPSDSLELAQQQKVEHVLRKLQLGKGMTLLDIGSGWGTLLIRAAQEYGVMGHGITLSKEQYRHCKKRVKELGLEKQLTFELANYQDLAERNVAFDRIVSVGMFEHVGIANHQVYFDAVDKMLAPNGLTVLHTILTQMPGPTDAWIDKYIFPGGYIPTISEIDKCWPQLEWRLLDFENLRIHYAKTLFEWSKRYEEHQDVIIKKYGEQFYRMWHLYLCASEAGFRWGDLGLGQFVFSKGVNNELPLTRDFLSK